MNCVVLDPSHSKSVDREARKGAGLDDVVAEFSNSDFAQDCDFSELAKVREILEDSEAGRSPIIEVQSD